MKPVVAFLLVAACVSCDAFAEEPATVFKLSGWTYGRERKTINSSNRVTSSVNIKNVSKSPMSDVVVTLTYTTGLGESVFNPLTQKLGDLKPGDIRTPTFAADLVPDFKGYTISLKYNGNKNEEWFGDSDAAQPKARTAPVSGEVNVVILGKETSIDKDGTFTGTMHLKNEGSEEAKELKLYVTFFDMRKNKVKEWSGTLGSGTLGGGVEKKIPFTIPNVPRNYGSYTMKLNNDGGSPDAPLAGGEFTKAEDVEFAHFKFHHAEPGKPAIKVDVQCRNGMKYPVTQVKLEVLFFDGKRREVKRFSHDVPGDIAAGEIKDVSFEIPNLPAYEEYEQRISFGKAAPPAPKAPVQVGEIPLQKKPDVEVVFGKIALNADKVIELKGTVRNGKNVPVKDIAIHLTFVKENGDDMTSVDRTLNSVLKPGEEKEVMIYSPKAVGAANYKYSFKFATATEK